MAEIRVSASVSEPVGGDLDDDDVARYRRDGAICLRGVFDADQVAVVERVVRAMLDDPGPHGQTASRPGEPAFFEDFCNWQRHPDLLGVIDAAGLPALCGRLMESGEVRLYHDHVLVKEPGARQPTPWHQDQPFYNVAGRQNISAWIPVDPVTRATTLEFVAGSHDGTWYLPTTFLDQQARWFPDGTLAPVPDVDPDTDRVLGWALDPGDVVLFHMLTLHAAAGNDMQHPRRALSLRFLGADATHAPRRWTTSPPFDGLDDELPAGAPMDHPLFPLLWTGRR
jgi:ectoine hydroxylase-related dioxygenase (phytanoyl-CoA dioxygenase family)